MELNYKFVFLVLLQAFSLGIFIVEEEYLMFVCVLLISVIVSLLIIELVKNWLETTRLEILSVNRNLNDKIRLELRRLLSLNKLKQGIRLELCKLLILERKKKLKVCLDREVLFLGKCKKTVLTR